MPKWAVRMVRKEKFSDTDDGAFSVTELHGVPGASVRDVMHAVTKQFFDMSIIEIKLEDDVDWTEVRSNRALLVH